VTRIEDRLRDLGDALDVADDDELAVAVVARLDDSAPAEQRRALLRVAAVVIVAVAVVVAAVPTSRRTVAGWFGFDGVTVELRPDVSMPAVPDPVDRGSSGGVGTVVPVDGTEVLVSEFVGSLDRAVIGKVATAETEVTEVDVGGVPGLWIEGAPHAVSFFDEEGDLASVAIAGNTLLWQDGDRIRRLEGFDELRAALAYASTLGDD